MQNVDMRQSFRRRLGYCCLMPDVGDLHRNAMIQGQYAWRVVELSCPPDPSLQHSSSLWDNQKERNVTTNIGHCGALV